MKKPVLLVVDDDKQVLRAVSRDLKSQYRSVYRIMSTTSPVEALEAAKELKKKNEIVALFLCDQRMPDMIGVELLEEVKPLFPDAKRVLLTAYSDTDAAIKAINDVQLDYYLLKPWDPPEEKLYPVLDDLLNEWQAGYRPDFKGIKVVGYPYSPKSHEIKDFLSGNLIPYRWLDAENQSKAEELLKLHDIEHKNLPAVFFEDGSYVTDPTLTDIAVKIGKNPKASEDVYDVVIVGAGPSGLAASVYGASEGLKTLLIEKKAPGGQAGTSSRIENYLGFPNGLSGSELTRRAITQTTRFGTEFISPCEVTNIKLNDQYKKVYLDDGSEINALSVVITTGVNYRKLNTSGIADFTGAGVYYGAAVTEAPNCAGKKVYIVGGGNSAGQGAMYLSNFASDVYILIRRDSLKSSMSQYLIDQINQTENIHVCPNNEVREAKGNKKLNTLIVENNKTGELTETDAGALFIFIGARPYTGWIGDHIIKNKKGFIETGRDLLNYPAFQQLWKLERDPFLLETSSPGIFAAGDVRAGAMNRVASAVGEGAMSIKYVHEYLDG